MRNIRPEREGFGEEKKQNTIIDGIGEDKGLRIGIIRGLGAHQSGEENAKKGGKVDFEYGKQ